MKERKSYRKVIYDITGISEKRGGGKNWFSMVSMRILKLTGTGWGV
jgi:hypothetical protein